MDLSQLQETKTVVFLGVLALLYILEILIPFFVERKGKFIHAIKNLGLGLLNVVVISVLFSSALLVVATSSFAQNYGLMNLIALPFWLEVVIVILLFDLWMYTWHVINHKIPLLWRFHRAHHSDEQVDASSALRFHTGEIVLSTIARLAVVPLLGIELWQLVLYEIILLPVIMFHHSNVNFPERYDRIYRLLFASPHMHWIHHSHYQPETDSNYGSIFSFWDRIFKTFRLRSSEKKYRSITQGLKEFRGKWLSFGGILKTPFVKK